jgi:hypothetical protein
VALLPRVIRPRKEGVGERVKTSRWPPVLEEDIGDASGLEESTAGDIGGCRMARQILAPALGEEGGGVGLGASAAWLSVARWSRPLELGEIGAGGGSGAT